VPPKFAEFSNALFTAKLLSGRPDADESALTIIVPTLSAKIAQISMQLSQTEGHTGAAPIGYSPMWSHSGKSYEPVLQEHRGDRRTICPSIKFAGEEPPRSR
jgi:hypothetical protein